MNNTDNKPTLKEFLDANPYRHTRSFTATEWEDSMIEKYDELYPSEQPQRKDQAEGKSPTVPLWRRLNGERTKGIVIADEFHLDIKYQNKQYPDAMGQTTFGSINSIFINAKEARANAQYTALCVNNLDRVASILKKLVETNRKGEVQGANWMEAYEAIKAIS